MKKFCLIVSRLLDFHFWAPVTLLLALLNTHLDLKQIALLAPLLLVFDILIPVCTHLFLLKTGKVGSFDIPKRQERITLFAVGAICSFIGTIFVFFIANRLFLALHLSFLFLTLTLFLVTFKWKISGHLIANSSAILMINFIFGWQHVWLFLLLPLIAFARMYLRVHTLSQVLAGTIVGISEPLLVLKLFNLI